MDMDMGMGKDVGTGVHMDRAQGCASCSAYGTGGGGEGGNMKLNAVWILNVLADTTRRTEKQKLWAKTAACGASLCAPPDTCLP